MHLEDIAERAESFSGADLESLFREAALNAILRDEERLEPVDLEAPSEKVGPSIDESTLARFRGIVIS